MTRLKSSADQPKMRLRRLLALQAVWIVTVLALGTWWGTLILKHARRIEELERLAGILKPENVLAAWSRTERMVYWEMGFFFLLLFLISLLLIVIYWRDYLRSRAIQAFFASLTHELKTPLTSIRLQAESLPGESHLVKRLLEDTTRLESQVERTLELARLEGGGKVNVQAIDLELWLQRNMKIWKDAYGQNLDLALAPSEQSINVLSDPHSLQIIFKNLIENAVKHSGRNPVKIKIYFEPQLSNGGAVLVFQDNGDSEKNFASISRPFLKKLGTIFEKGPRSNGAGVGLYLVQSLMKHMGGYAEFRPMSDGFRVGLHFLGDQA